MKKNLYFVLAFLALTFQSCNDKEPEVDYTSGFVGEHEISYVIKDSKKQEIIGTDSLISAVAMVTLIRKDNSTLTAEVYIDDPRIKINETVEVLVSKDPDPVDYISLPDSTAKLEGKYFLHVASPNLVSGVAVSLYTNKKIAGGLTYVNSMGNRWLTFK